jgi:D-glycero-alpha-D-manno-heptose-7-phosphate kinase
MIELNDNLMLFYTGMTHSANQILKEQSDNITNDQRKFDSLVRMTDLVYDARRAL